MIARLIRSITDSTPDRSPPAAADTPDARVRRRAPRPDAPSPKSSAPSAPAAIHARQAPLDARARRADRLAVDEHEHRIGVRRRQDAQRDPAAALDRHVERDIADRPVRDDRAARRRIAVHHHFHRHLARVADARAFEVPIRLACRSSTPLNDAFAAAPSSRAATRAVTFTVDALSSRNSLPFTPIATSFTLKSIRWLLPSVDVRAAVADAFRPAVVRQRLVELHVAAAEADALAVDARESRFRR